ncbi:MAG: DNA polymerase I [Nitrospirae bacterium GWC2_42_7]|nr:MAG: DNA polymerase I [Nitrospirae bacterium GWC2_42_7]
MDLYLIDGNSYVYRAFYAIRGLTNSKGFPTNAIYGFTNMLLKIIREKKPESLVVSFDTPAITERHKLFKEYKAHRPETPQELVQQLPYIREMISALNIKIFEIPGYEADDLIGTIAKKASSVGDNVFIVTSDKDMLQLVDKNVKIYDPGKDRILDEEYVKEKFGVGPERVTEFMALTGDASDNIPGIKGIGEKTAKELLSEFSSLEDIFLHADKIKKDKLRAMVKENKDIALLSQQLATIDTAVPFDIDLNEFGMKEPNWLSLLTLFKEFEFTTMMKLLPSVGNTERRYETINAASRLREVVSEIKDCIAIDTEATGKDPLADTLVGLSLCVEKEKAFYIPVAHSPLIVPPAEQTALSDISNILGPVLVNETIPKIGHNLKYDLMLLGQNHIKVRGKLFDTMIAAYLLNPNKPNHSLDEVAFEYLSKRKRSFAEVLKKRSSFAEVTIEEATPYAAEDAALSFELKEILFRKLEENGLENIYFDIEMPLIEVLISVEKNGIKINPEILNDFSCKMAAEIDSIQKRVFFLAGEEFNINSPKQLSMILFQRLGLSPSKKTKTGFSTGMEVLEELSKTHELPKEVLNYRSLTKLKSTYLDVLPGLINQRTGRIHTSFNQTVTATGRLSSSEPNLQNIPIRGDWGKRIREAFIAEEGNLLLSADYSQVELRILAHLSQDKGLADAFRDGLDIHTRTAAELYSVPLDKVTTEMRRIAKTVNFGVIYGISAYGLSEALDIERKEAEKYIKQYFDRHQGVREYIDRSISEAEKIGYVLTLFKRKRPVPELQNKNRNIRQQGERLAVNSPIQGTAADIIKLAMINIHRRFRTESINAKMILQVHDELLFELPDKELDKVRELVREEMEGAIKLSVPLKVEIGHGNNWAEAH